MPSSGPDRLRLFAALLVVGGVTLLLLLQGSRFINHSNWPLMIIVPGLVTFAVGALVSGSLRFVAVSGAVVTATGLILFAQELTNYYQSWAYLWPLLPAASGVALLVTARGDETTNRMAWSLLASSALLLVLFASVFESMIFHGDFLVGGLAVAIVLILAGAMLFIRSNTAAHAKDDSPAAPPTST